MKASRFSLLLLLLVLFAACSGGPTDPNQRFEPYPEESQILGLANAFRAQARTCGTQQLPAAPALTWVEAVGDTAWFHSIAMGAQDTENHVGASTTDRLKARGFEPGLTAEHRKKTALPANPSEAFNVWSADPVACANLMSPNFTVLGAGLWGKYEGGSAAYWTLILTTPQGAPAQPSLMLAPTTATTTVGGPALTFTATLTNSAEALTFSLSGPGSFTSVGATATYTPPTTGGAGTATLTATAGALTASAVITINAAGPSLTVTPTSAMVAVGSAPIQFKASTNQVSWTMTGVGTFSWVGETFTYTPPASGTGGTATITVKSGNLTATATVTVVTLSIVPATASVAVGGAAIPFTATLTSSTDPITWSLVGPGAISTTMGATTNYTPPTAGGADTATLTATVGTVTATATITINAAAPVPTLSLTPTTATVTVGGAGTTFTATLTDSTETINWTLAGPGSLSSQTGPATSYTPPATGAAGTATLTATAGALTATATITINAAEPPYQETFLALINAFRSQPQTCKRGATDEAMPAVPPVSLNTALNTAAQLHSQDMADNNYFSHTGLNGSTFSDRALAQGYTGFPAGENIAAGQPTAQAAFDAWRNSTGGHCQGMMSANADEIGIGHGHNAASQWKHYWTLVMGKKQ
jgi:uncharacterized protein YkwD